MEKVPVPVTGGILFAFFFVYFIDLFFPFLGIWGFFFQLFLQLLILGIIQCVIVADPISSSEAKGGLPSMLTQLTRALERANDQDNEEQ
jgi:hypothetical protein